MADIYTPETPFSPAFDTEDTTEILRGLLSPVDAAEIKSAPPSSPPQTGPGVSTPQTGSLSYAPSQAQPKVSGPAMIPGVATKPENLVASAAQTQPSGSTLLMPQPGGNPALGSSTKYARLPISTAGAPMQPGTTQPAPLQSRWSRILAQTPQQDQPASPNLTSNPLPGSPMPALPAAAQPSVVPDQLNLQTQQDQARLAQLQNQPSGGSQIKRPWLRDIVRTLDVAGSAIAPNVLQYVPQSTIGHQVQVGRQQGIVNSDQAQQQARAQIEDTQQKTALDAAKAAGTAPIQVTPEMNAQNPSLIIGSMIRPQDLGKTENTQTQNQRFTDQDVQKAAAKGQKPVKDAKGNITGFEDDTNSSLYVSRKTQDDLRQTQEALTRAKTDAANADPNTPAGRQAIAKLKELNAGHTAAMIRAQAAMINARGGYMGTDENGRPLNGVGMTPNGQPIGTHLQSQYTKNAGNIAKFQDVYSSIDNANDAIESAKNSGDDFNSAQMAEALSDPKTTSQQWLAGKVNTTLSPEQQNLVITTKALREQINAMRSSVGGGVSDSQINRLVDQLPSATTPSLAYAQKQLATVRGQLDRLQAGLPEVNNGPTVQQPGAPANPTAPGGVPPGIPKANSVLIRPGKGQAISRQTAQQYLQKAGGDPAKASQLAARDGWKF